jgi:Nucleotidyl transferase AbiEii toxin, Type IV TA system
MVENPGIRVTEAHQQIFPCMEILPDAQKQLWPELAEVSDQFILYGGTAIALHLGHRQSIDFDFFCFAPIDPDLILDQITFLDGGRVLQKSPNSLTVLVDRGGPVQISFFGVPKLKRLRPPLCAPGNDLQIADLLDLAGTKAAVVQKRAEAKDYIDLDAIITRGGISLPMALSAAAYLYGTSFNPEITLKALCYFEDGNVATIPADVRDRLLEAVREVDFDALPSVQPESENNSLRGSP